MKGVYSFIPYLPAASLGFMGLRLRVRDLGWRVRGRTLMVCLLGLIPQTPNPKP